MGKLDGKVAIVTGGAMGMGSGCAKVMAKYGAKLALIDYNEKVFETAANLEKQGCQVMAFHIDVRDKAAINDAFKKVVEKYGKIDVLVNAAGIFVVENFLDFTDEARDAVINTNFQGMWNTCKAAIPYMLENKYGKIVNFSSVTGNKVTDPGMTAYGTSKGAVLAFTKTLAAEFASRNIWVNSIMPGFADTPMVDNFCKQFYPDNDPEEIKDSIATNVPMKRLGRIEEAGEVVAFLASDESSYVTGTYILFDGGSGLPETTCSEW